MRYMNYLKTSKKALVLSAILMASPLLAATNRPFDPTLLAKVNPSTDTSYSAFNTKNSQDGIALADTAHINNTNPCSPDFATVAESLGMKKIKGLDGSTGTASVQPGTVTMLACFKPVTTQTQREGSGSGNFNNLIIFDPSETSTGNGFLASNQPMSSIAIGGATKDAVMAGYIDYSDPAEYNASIYMPRVINHTFFVQKAATLTSDDFSDMNAAQNAGQKSAIAALYVYQGSTPTTRIPDLTSLSNLYGYDDADPSSTNLIVDKSNWMRGKSATAWKDAYPFLIHTGLEVGGNYMAPAGTTWADVYKPFTATLPAALQADVTKANTALAQYPLYNSVTFDKDSSKQTIAPITKVGYYEMTTYKNNYQTDILSDNPVWWPQAASGSSEKYTLSFWVKPENANALTAMKKLDPAAPIVNLSDKNAPSDGNNIVFDSTTMPDDLAVGQWSQVTETFTVNAVELAFPMIEIKPLTIDQSAATTTWGVTDFKFTPISITTFKTNAIANQQPNYEMTPESSTTAPTGNFYDFSKDDITMNDWRIRNKGVGSSNDEEHTGALGSNLEYVNACSTGYHADGTCAGGTWRRVLRFRNFGGDDDTNVFDNQKGGPAPLITPANQSNDALGYNLEERQGSVIASTHAYSSADYVLCVRYPRRVVGQFLNNLINKDGNHEGTYYPNNTGGVSAIWPYHYETLQPGMIGYDDSTQAVLRNSEVDIETPAFDGVSSAAPFPASLSASESTAFDLNLTLKGSTTSTTVAKCIDDKGCSLTAAGKSLLGAHFGDSSYARAIDYLAPKKTILTGATLTAKVTDGSSAQICFANSESSIALASEHNTVSVGASLCSGGVNNYSYRIARYNTWGGDFSGYGNNVSARPITPLPEQGENQGGGLDDGKFHQVTIEVNADSKTAAGSVKWYYNDTCQVQSTLESGGSFSSDQLGSLIHMSNGRPDGAGNPTMEGVLWPKDMLGVQPAGQQTNEESVVGRESNKAGFDDVPHQAMELTLGIWSPASGKPVDADSAETKQALGWGGTPDYIDEDHLGTETRFSSTPYSDGAAAFRCRNDNKGKAVTDKQAQSMDPDCATFASKYDPNNGVMSTTERTTFIKNWLQYMQTKKTTYNLPGLNPVRNDDVFINPIDMTSDASNARNYALTAASFGGKIPTNLDTVKQALEAADNERDLDVSSIYVKPLDANVLDATNTDNYKDNASCPTPAKDKASGAAEAIKYQCAYMNGTTAYQFPASATATPTATTYPVDIAAKP